MLLSRRFNRSFAPHRVSLNVTLRCNLTHHTTCYDSRAGASLEIASLTKPRMGWKCSIPGGEPFMRGDIETILSYAVSRGFYVTVTTNGTLITEARSTGHSRYSVWIGFTSTF